MYFKGVGIDTQIKPNVIDFASSNTENSTLKADTSRMNEANKCAVGAVCKMANDNIINTQEKSAERQKIEKNDEVRHNFLQRFLIENYGPDRDRGNRNPFMPGI